VAESVLDRALDYLRRCAESSRVERENTFFNYVMEQHVADAIGASRSHVGKVLRAYWREHGENAGPLNHGVDRGSMWCWSEARRG